jgi:hypothetical protein
MTISYITTDLECDSASNLSVMVEKWGENVIVHLNDWGDNVYRVAVRLAHTDTTVDDAVRSTGLSLKSCRRRPKLLGITALGAQ